MNQNMCSVCGDGKQMVNTGDFKKKQLGKGNDSNKRKEKM